MMQDGPTEYMEVKSGGADRVVQHVPCLRCGYDLFGCPRSAACPECETTVSASLCKRRLFFAPERRIRSVCLGIKLWMLWIVVTVTSIVLPDEFYQGMGRGLVIYIASLLLLLIAPCAILTREWFSFPREHRGILSTAPVFFMAGGLSVIIVRGLIAGHLVRSEFLLACGVPIGFHLQAALFSMRIPHRRSTVMNVIVAFEVLAMAVFFLLRPWYTSAELLAPALHMLLPPLALILSCTASFVTERRLAREVRTIVEFRLRPT